MIDDEIRRIVAEQGRLAVDVTELAETADLYKFGLSSHASVGIMLALEDAFDVMFSEEMLSRETFSSIAALRAAITTLMAPAGR